MIGPNSATHSGLRHGGIGNSAIEQAYTFFVAGLRIPDSGMTAIAQISHNARCASRLQPRLQGPTMPLPALLDGKLSLPVIGSPMFIVSTPELVIAQCKAGVVGSFPALNARPKEQLALWLERITGELAAYQAANPQKKVAPF